jgi:hypothetical protein
VPVPQRIGTSPLRANAPVPGAARHTPAPTAKASVSVSTPEPTPAAPRVIAAATPRPASNTQHPWALIAAACFAAAMAAALIFFASFTRR